MCRGEHEIRNELARPTVSLRWPTKDEEIFTFPRMLLLLINSLLSSVRSTRSCFVQGFVRQLRRQHIVMMTQFR